MILLLKLISITSILVLGWTIVTQKGMALYSVREWANKKYESGEKWIDPLLLCHWCMPSSWSLIGFGFAFGLGIIESFEWELLLMYILTVGGSSLVNGLIWGLHLKWKEETEYFKNINEQPERNSAS